MQWLFQCHHPHWFHAASCTGGEQWWRYSERRGDAPWKICSVQEHNPSTKDCHFMQKNTSAMAVPDDCAAHKEKSTPADVSVVTPALQIVVPSPSNTPEPGRWDPQELSTLLRASPKHSHSLVQHVYSTSPQHLHEASKTELFTAATVSPVQQLNSIVHWSTVWDVESWTELKSSPASSSMKIPVLQTWPSANSQSGLAKSWLQGGHRAGLVWDAMGQLPSPHKFATGIKHSNKWLFLYDVIVAVVVT